MQLRQDAIVLCKCYTAVSYTTGQTRTCCTIRAMLLDTTGTVQSLRDTFRTAVLRLWGE